MKILLLALVMALIPLTLAHENETISLTLNLTEQQYIIENNCNITISVSAQKETFGPGEQIIFYNNLSEKSHSFKIRYYVIDENNTIVKASVITQNLNAKYFTPKERKYDYEITIKNELLEINCNNTNPLKVSEKTLLIRGNPNITEKTVETKDTAKKSATAKQETKAAAKEQKKEETAKKDYTITPLASSESLLNDGSDKNTTEIFISGQEKARTYAPYILIAALILLVVYLMKNDIKDKSNNRSSWFSRKTRKRSYSEGD